MLAPGERRQGLSRVVLVARLAVDAAAERDEGVDAEDRPTSLRDGGSLPVRVLERDVERRALADLLDVGRTSLEGDAELFEDRPALRGAAG